MKLIIATILVSGLGMGVGCDSRSDVSIDASLVDGRLVDAPGGLARLPVWSLEDIQPMSTRFGQTYGLDTFSNKVVVVTLLEGF